MLLIYTTAQLILGQHFFAAIVGLTLLNPARNSIERETLYQPNIRLIYACRHQHQHLSQVDHRSLSTYINAIV